MDRGVLKMMANKYYYSYQRLDEEIIINNTSRHLRFNGHLIPLVTITFQEIKND